MITKPEGLKYWVFNEEVGVFELKKSAPDWAKKEFKRIMDMVSDKPDEKGIVTLD